MRNPLKQGMMKSRKGASLVEYSLLTGLIGVVSITAVVVTGTEVKETFEGSEAVLASSLSGGQAGGSQPIVIAPECYNAANIGTVGAPTWSGCADMLIVSRAMLDAAGGDYTSGGGGDHSFDIKPSDPYAPAGLTQTYTFAQDGNDIFTGQVSVMSAIFDSTDFNGDISYWDTSNVTAFYNLFWGTTQFNQRLDWDFSSAISLSGMFQQAQAYNQPIEHWANTGGITDMGAMFDGAVVFNQPVLGLDVSSVTNMGAMFAGTQAFNQSLANFIPPSARDIGGILFNAQAFTREADLATWNVSNVEDFNNMIASTSLNPDITGWDTSSVVSGNGMQFMFADNDTFNRDLSGWCVENIPTQPSGFDQNATAWTAARPNWGQVCP